MIVGLGSIGLYVLEILARIPRIGKILATDFDEDRGVRITNNAILGAAQQGLFPRIEFVKIDLFNITDTAHMLKDVLPDLIIKWFFAFSGIKTAPLVGEQGVGSKKLNTRRSHYEQIDEEREFLNTLYRGRSNCDLWRMATGQRREAR